MTESFGPKKRRPKTSSRDCAFSMKCIRCLRDPLDCKCSANKINLHGYVFDDVNFNHRKAAAVDAAQSYAEKCRMLFFLSANLTVPATLNKTRTQRLLSAIGLRLVVEVYHDRIFRPKEAPTENVIPRLRFFYEVHTLSAGSPRLQMFSKQDQSSLLRLRRR